MDSLRPSSVQMAPVALQSVFRFAVAGFGRDWGFALVFVGGNVPTRCQVVPGQPSVFPAEVQVQDCSVAVRAEVLRLTMADGVPRMPPLPC